MPSFLVEEFVHTLGHAGLNAAAILITCGGLFDLLVPRLPSNLAKATGGNPEAARLVRELLRALGGCLVAVGLALAVLADSTAITSGRGALALILVLVIPSEGINSVAMYRAGSPYYIPAAFLTVAVASALLAFW